MRAYAINRKRIIDRLTEELSSFLTANVRILIPKTRIPKNLKAVGPSASSDNPIIVIKISGINMKPRPKNNAKTALKINIYFTLKFIFITSFSKYL
jgi:hypothetical protein